LHLSAAQLHSLTVAALLLLRSSINTYRAVKHAVRLVGVSAAIGFVVALLRRVVLGDTDMLVELAAYPVLALLSAKYGYQH
jgi:hypothetical protein